MCAPRKPDDPFPGAAPYPHLRTCPCKDDNATGTSTNNNSITSLLGVKRGQNSLQCNIAYLKRLVVQMSDFSGPSSVRKKSVTLGSVAFILRKAYCEYSEWFLSNLS